ncbi:hypothetical protein [Candidatus Berkiella aquae]|uniref:Uncharacterized protein n=1 Tax=Candidatus Berkiella aquae TaxID=295108 RepID=A0A0Q9YNX0_9GAMM|nr:hypothetical protein [Candidatus Berkiella aquae]MCS5712144.1 hypothetical protein [Candidatus Berkiella aquae]
MTLIIDSQINPISLLCSRLSTLGFDVFTKMHMLREALGIDNLDENKLRNVLTCEEKRLKQFATHFSHDQHLMNLQSLLIGALKHLLLNLSNEATSADEFRRQLSRIAVISHEIDTALAKAKRKLRLDIETMNIKRLIEENLLTLAADKTKAVEKLRQYHPAYPLENLWYSWFEEKKKAFFAELRWIESHARNAYTRLYQYQLHILRCCVKANVDARVKALIDEKVKAKTEVKLKQIIAKMTGNQEQQQAIFEQAVKKLHYTPSLKPRLR